MGICNSRIADCHGLHVCRACLAQMELYHDEFMLSWLRWWVGTKQNCNIQFDQSPYLIASANAMQCVMQGLPGADGALP